MLRLVVTSVLVGCGGQPALPVHPLPPARSWQLRFCNDTSNQIERLYFDGDNSIGGLHAGGCSAYMDSEHLTQRLQLSMWIEGQELDRDVDNPSTLAFGYYSFRIARSGGEIEIRRVADLPMVVTRICNRTQRRVDELLAYATIVELPMEDGVCTPYRPASMPAGYRDGSFAVGSNYTDPVKYAIEPLAASPSLGPGAWTFDLVITDDNAHRGTLRRHGSPD